MPVMDGFEATRKLRLMPALADVPVIATSASATREVEERSRAAGADDFIVKPIEQGALLKIIGRLLDLSWIHDDPEPPWAQLDGVDEASLMAPPPEEMAVLRRLARTGNMRSIRERADYLKTLNDRYVPFATRLASLAEGCQSKAIVALVEFHSTERDER